MPIRHLHQNQERHQHQQRHQHLKVNENGTKHAAWVGLWKNVLSFAAGIVVAAFVLGSARQKMSDLQKWKDETAPRIERMDRTGTTSFDLFHKEYLRTQARQEESLKELAKEIKELQRK